LQLLADGHTRKELSRHLGASASEIDSLLEELFAAMGAATQAEAIAAAHKRGLFKEAQRGATEAGSGPPPLPHDLSPSVVRNRNIRGQDPECNDKE